MLRWSLVLLIPALGWLVAGPSAPGPARVVVVDAAHGNYHTIAGRYGPFAALLRDDGFSVVGRTDRLTGASLEGVDVLVIANALAPRNRQDWSLPTPSAFAPEEIEAVARWVAGGGALLLIADHMPFPGAAAELAARFGIELANGFVLTAQGQGLIRFDRTGGTLAPHPLLDGDPPIDHVVSFTGHGFAPAPGVEVAPLLILPTGAIQLLPEQAWVFTEDTPRQPAGGLLQGATLQHGEGRVAVFGEAAMFTSQSAGPDQLPLGFDHPEAAHNRAFVRRVVRWLAGDRPDR